MPEFLKLLRRIAKCNRAVTIIIRSGENCCSHTGCIAEVVENSYVVLITAVNDTCQRTYIPLECICAVIDPANNNAEAPA
ncbi:hypothetical protein [Natronospora cellulosivora (SeqCode)]